MNLTQGRVWLYAIRLTQDQMTELKMIMQQDSGRIMRLCMGDDVCMLYVHECVYAMNV